jgi:hypothetical protein
LPVQKAMLLAEPDAIVTSPWQRIAVAVVVTTGELAMAPVGMVLGRYEMSLAGVLIPLLSGRISLVRLRARKADRLADE